MNRRVAVALAAFVFIPAVASAQSGLPRSCPGGGTTNSQLPGINAGITSPFVWAFINGECTDLSDFIKAATPGKLWVMDTGRLDIGGIIIQATGVFNADPFITFGATTTNLTGSAVTYAFLFGTPVVPGFYTDASSTGSLSLTSGVGTATVVPSGIYPTYISGYGTVGFSPTNLGVDLGTAPCTSTGVSTTCNYGAASNTFGPTFYDNLEALLTYTQTGTAGVASWSGKLSLTVPEPATIALVGPVLIVLVGLARRRRLTD